MNIEKGKDAWRQRTGSKALQNLGHYLEKIGIPDFYSASIVEDIWVFYSYYLLPTYGYKIDLGISVRNVWENRILINLSLPHKLPSRDSNFQNKYKNSTSILEQVLPSWECRRCYSQLLLDFKQKLSYRLETTVLGKNDSFNSVLKSLCMKRGEVYIGIYRDNLLNELKTFIAKDELQDWLSSPNVLLWPSPGDILKKEKRSCLAGKPIRDFISSVKSGLTDFDTR